MCGMCIIDEMVYELRITNSIYLSHTLRFRIDGTIYFEYETAHLTQVKRWIQFWERNVYMLLQVGQTNQLHLPKNTTMIHLLKWMIPFRTKAMIVGYPWIWWRIVVFFGWKNSHSFIRFCYPLFGNLWITARFSHSEWLNRTD